MSESLLSHNARFAAAAHGSSWAATALHLISSGTRTRSRAGSSLEDPKRHLRRYPSRECFLMRSINSSKEPTTWPLPWGLFLLVWANFLNNALLFETISGNSKSRRCDAQETHRPLATATLTRLRPGDHRGHHLLREQLLGSACSRQGRIIALRSRPPCFRVNLPGDPGPP